MADPISRTQASVIVPHSVYLFQLLKGSAFVFQSLSST